MLGETGATVCVTDREARGHKHSELPGTVEDHAEQLIERGGHDVALPLDHCDDDGVAALSARIRRDHGGHDLPVANACNGDAIPFASGPFWPLPLDHWANMMHVGVRSHLVSAWYAAPLLIERHGLVVLTGYTDPGAEVIGNHVFYDLAMTSVSRLARSLAHDLRPHGVTAPAVSPGLTRTEAIVAALGDHLPPGTDSVELPGRAVRAPLEDPDVARYEGRTVPVAELAERYRLGDIEPAVARP